MTQEIYIIMGEKENVSQTRIGGPFEPHPRAEPVHAVTSEEAAQRYIETRKLKKPSGGGFSDTCYYRDGYYDMYYEKIELRD